MILDHTTGERHALIDTTPGDDYKISGVSFDLGLLRTGDYLCVITEYSSVAGSPSAYLKCTYNGNVYYFETLSDWNTLVCRIPYVSTANRVVEVSSKNPSTRPITLDGTAVTSIPLAFSACDTVPFVSFTPELYANYSNPLTITHTPGDNGHFGAVFALYLYLRAPGKTSFTRYSLLSQTTTMQCSYPLENFIDYEWYTLLNFRTYDTATWGNSYNNYVTVSKIVSPTQKITRDATIPLSPTSIATEMLLAGSTVTVSWPAVNDKLLSVTGYTLERSTDGVNFTTLYTGTSLQYPDTVPSNADNVWYRLRTNTSTGVSSAWYTTDALPITKSNVYIGTAGGIRIVSAIHIGSHRASPLVYVG